MKKGNYYGGEITPQERLDYYKDVVRYLHKVTGLKFVNVEEETIKEYRNVIDILLEEL
jgi:hypothetical protein